MAAVVEATLPTVAADAPRAAVLRGHVAASHRRSAPFSWSRTLALAFTMAVHAAALLWLSRPTASDQGRSAVTTVSAVRSVDGVVVAVEARTDAAADRPVPSVPTAPRQQTRPARPVVALEPPAIPVAPPAGRPQDRRLDDEWSPLLDADGRPRLSDRAFARLEHSADAPDAFHTPGRGGEDDVFYRPPPIEYRETRFERVWQPSQGLVDEWTGKLQRAITTQVRVPLNPRFGLVCQVTLTGMGSCRIVRNAGTGVIVERPPPPPWERAQRVQCAELRARLAAATTADEVAHLLDRLQALCLEAGEP